MAGPPASEPPMTWPLLVVLSGPSGVGKDSALARLRSLPGHRYFAVTATTRSVRPGERDGVDYIFLDHQVFQRMVQEGELLEYAQVYGNWYGVPKAQVTDAMGRGQDVVLKLDVQGAATIKGLAPEAVFIFLAPSSMEELRDRLLRRGTESGRDLDGRASIAWAEMKHLAAFDYVVTNRDGVLDEAVASIDAIIKAEKCRVTPRQVII